ncbi:hypothetical protein HRW07_04670 [Streptomyces lunaelactis]|uniref:hypothetical protein n=1 Tax=Streptomyces lunaelactis TaxID=1535768 RepID=UPI001585428A|nr:hypothetical protein [Streptomyces lunaelactis]NUL02549.1 hypothetical protein [Streptomyces lunaelactis]
MTTELKHVEVVDAELVDDAPAAGAVAPHDPATAAVLTALDHGAEQHLKDIWPKKTRDGYARDWALWAEFHGWLAERTNDPLPLTAVTTGTLVGFVVWLDEVKKAAPNSIDRRLTGVTVTARSMGAEVPTEATRAARTALKPLKLDPVRQARGRGQAVAITLDQIRRMNTADSTAHRAPGLRRRRTYARSELAVLRDRALHTLAFGIAGRSQEVSALDDTGITLVAEGLEVHVPSVKGRPARDVVVAYGEYPETCPVRCWLAWKEAAGLDGGPVFRPIDQWGNLSPDRLGPDGCRQAQTRAAERAGLDARITGHSYRAGLITTGRKKGKRAEKLRAQSGHAENSPAFWRYVRDGEKWEDAATDGIGL